MPAEVGRWLPESLSGFSIEFIPDDWVPVIVE